MAPPNRTTPEQLEWLTSIRPEFLEHQKNKTLSVFWSKLDHDWFTRWPEPGVAEAEVEPEGHPLRDAAEEALSIRKSYLRNWFNNRSVSKRKVPIKIAAIVPPTRTLQAIELYSHEHYKEKVQALVDAACAKKDLPQGMRLNIVKALTKATFDAEPEEVRDAFFARAAALKIENAARRAQARDSEPKADPESYANALQSLSYVLETFISDLAARTGWSFSVMGGGPDPASGGIIKAISLHEGRNFLGATFKRAHASFQEGVAKPYQTFLEQVYSPAVCEARALPAHKIEPLKNPSLESGTVAVHGDLLAMEDEDGNVGSARPLANAVVADESAVERGHSPPAPTSDSLGTQDMDMSLIDPQLAPTSDSLGTQDMDMSLIDPQLRSSPSSSFSSTTAPFTFNFPSTPHFAPQTAIGSVISSSLGPLSSNIPTPPTFSLPVSAVPSPRVVPGPSPPLPTAADVELPTAPSPPSFVTSPTAANVAPPPKKGPAKRPKPRRRPAVQPPSALQKAVENAETLAVAQQEQGGVWSTELLKAVKAAEAKTAKAAEAKARKAATAAETKATKAKATEVQEASAPAPASNASVVQLGRPQRIRKAATSKEVVTLTDDRKRKGSKENESCPKKIRTR